MNFPDDSFQPLLSSPLHVRWTSSLRGVLDAKVLATITPLNEAGAEQLFEVADRRARSLSIHRRDPPCEQLAVTALGDADVVSWMVGELPKNNRPKAADLVLVSWDAASGVRTTWATFSANWRTFCHPGQDDVVVLPVAGDWVIFHHHDERLYVG